MSGSTPNGLPYPTGTDKVRDGDNAMQALAEAADRADTVAQAGANLASAGIATGRTGWGITPASADPSGRLSIGANGIVSVKPSIVFVQFQPTLTTSGTVSFAIVLNDPNNGPVYASTVYSPGGPGTRVTGMWVLAAGSSFHPVFLASTAGSQCSGGFFEMFAFNNRAA